jgi:hypothetical protein
LYKRCKEWHCIFFTWCVLFCFNSCFQCRSITSKVWNNVSSTSSKLRASITVTSPFLQWTILPNNSTSRCLNYVTFYVCLNSFFNIFYYVLCISNTIQDVTCFIIGKGTVVIISIIL